MKQQRKRNKQKKNIFRSLVNPGYNFHAVTILPPAMYNFALSLSWPMCACTLLMLVS